MHKHILSAVMTAVLLTAVVTVTLYNGNEAHAALAKQPRSFLPSGLTGHPTASHAMPMTSATTGAARHMTNVTRNATNNMTNATGGAMGAAENATGNK